MERKAIIIGGSPRRNGNTDYIASVFDNYLQQQNFSTRFISLPEMTYSSCIGCENCRIDKICTGLEDDLTPIYAELLSSQIWVLGTPVHNYNVSAWMKGFIDRLYCFYDFANTHPRAYSSRLEGKGIGCFIYGIAEQLTENDFGFAIEAMEKPLQALGINIISSYKFYGYFSKILKNDHQKIDQFKRQLDNDFKSKNNNFSL